MLSGRSEREDVELWILRELDGNMITRFGQRLVVGDGLK
jgi:hypothetical protein